MSESNGAIIAALAAKPTDFEGRALEHYAKALRKHPRFADALQPFDHRIKVEDALYNVRARLAKQEKTNKVLAVDLLECELLEAFFAETDAEKVSELYDAVAVLMRMIAVVEGKQTLGGKEAEE